MFGARACSRLAWPLLALALAGCTSSGYEKRRGLDPVLDAAKVEQASNNTVLILRALARDAGLNPDAPGDWYLVAEAGFNYIDDQCRDYFDTLFFLDRRRERLKTAIAAAGQTTSAILGITGASAASLAVVAQAFGFGVHATELIAGTYLYSLPPAATQGFVQRLQLAFRDAAAANRAGIYTPTSAYYMIQRYLDLCLPPRIEAEITKQISSANAVQVPRGGGAFFSLETVSAPPSHVLVPPPTRVSLPARVSLPGPVSPRVRVPTPSSVAIPGGVPSRAEPSGPSRVTVTSRTRVSEAGRPVSRTDTPPRSETPPAYAQFIAGYDPQKHSRSLVLRAMGALCLTQAEIEAGGAKARDLIGVFEATVPSGDDDAMPTADGKLDAQEINRLLRSGPCLSDHRNFYEKQTFPSGKVSADFANRLYVALGSSKKAEDAVALSALRPEITEFRRRFGEKLALKGANIADQITPDLAQLVRRGGAR